ncbi:MAG: hypothetical protein DRJ40_10935 [Thermoprotei archaeon]|nr:MAG: hypothetical protein DRJ40_10935 [Thermoprotei archaeon]
MRKAMYEATKYTQPKPIGECRCGGTVYVWLYPLLRKKTRFELVIWCNKCLIEDNIPVNPRKLKRDVVKELYEYFVQVITPPARLKEMYTTQIPCPLCSSQLEYSEGEDYVEVLCRNCLPLIHLQGTTLSKTIEERALELVYRIYREKVRVLTITVLNLVLEAQLKNSQILMELATKYIELIEKLTNRIEIYIELTQQIADRKLREILENDYNLLHQLLKAGIEVAKKVVKQQIYIR